jgi:hypothetical protein
MACNFLLRAQEKVTKEKGTPAVMAPLTKFIPELVLAGMLRMSKFAPGEFVIFASCSDAPITAN